MSAGRPTDYTVEIAEKICDLIGETVPIHVIAAMEGMPKERTIYQWLKKHEEFAQDYARAHEARGHRYAYDAITIADEAPETIKGVEKAALRCRNRIWAAERAASKVYGPRYKQEITGANGGPVEIKQDVDLSKLSDATLAELAALVAGNHPAGD